ncbi:MAG: divergent polysaccharide deacetylase family protein, partial [Rhodobacterales bacterium]|nr:divergent polysaccharide deacetylase family protein [Rhodobacterales bacterium]
GKPAVAIVLIDPGTADLDRDGLASLPFPISVALDPMDPATPERSAIYRAAGKEVVMLATGIAEGAQASDIEVAFQSMAQGLPEAVAVMDLSVPTFQNRRPLASLVVPVIGAQGRGLLTWDEGLNAADQVARREDIPSAVVFRDLTSGGTDSAAIRRVLDRAIFKAGQDGRAVVAGTASPETVAALLEWSVEGRAATVALAPLTGVLTVE